MKRVVWSRGQIIYTNMSQKLTFTFLFRKDDPYSFMEDPEFRDLVSNEP